MNDDTIGGIVDNAVGPMTDELDRLGIDIRRREDGSIVFGPEARDLRRDPRDRPRDQRDLRRDERAPRDGPYDEPDYDPEAPN